MKSSFEALSREFVEKNTIVKLKDTSVCNVLIKAVCLTSASLAAYSNVIEELQKNL